MDTDQSFIHLHGWYKIHKILIHGADVKETFLLPITKSWKQDIKKNVVFLR